MTEISRRGRVIRSALVTATAVTLAFWEFVPTTIVVGCLVTAWIGGTAWAVVTDEYFPPHRRRTPEPKEWTSKQKPLFPQRWK